MGVTADESAGTPSGWEEGWPAEDNDPFRDLVDSLTEDAWEMGFDEGARTVAESFFGGEGTEVDPNGGDVAGPVGEGD